jgi:hypothetical protein
VFGDANAGARNNERCASRNVTLSARLNASHIKPTCRC